MHQLFSSARPLRLILWPFGRGRPPMLGTIQGLNYQTSNTVATRGKCSLHMGASVLTVSQPQGTFYYRWYFSTFTDTLLNILVKQHTRRKKKKALICHWKDTLAPLYTKGSSRAPPPHTPPCWEYFGWKTPLVLTCRDLTTVIKVMIKELNYSS